MNAREAGDHGALDLAGDRLHCLEVAGRGDREAGLDHVDPQARELVGDLELLARVQRDPGALLPVPQGGVEDEYAVVGHVTPLVGCSFLSPLVCGFAAATRYSPEGGGEEGGGAARVTCAAQPTSGCPSAKAGKPGRCSSSSRTGSAASAP